MLFSVCISEGVAKIQSIPDQYGMGAILWKGIGKDNQIQQLTDFLGSYYVTHNTQVWSDYEADL